MYMHMKTKMLVVQEHIKELGPILKAKNQFQDGNKVQGMNLMDIVFIVLTLDTRQWIVQMDEKILEDKATQLDAGHATKKEILWPHVIL